VSGLPEPMVVQPSEQAGSSAGVTTATAVPSGLPESAAAESAESTRRGELSNRQMWLVFSVTSLGVLLTGLNASTLDVALPTVSRHFSASAVAASWILLSYLLVSTVLILPFGRLADIIGRRRLYLLGLALLTFSSLVAGAAPDVAVLILARIGQAVGAASIMANVSAILTDAFPTRKLSLALGLNVTVAGVGLVAGPAIGGLLADSVGWRSVFWFNVPFGVIGLAWAAATLREQRRSGTREPFDLTGAVLSLIVIGSLITSIALGGTKGWAAWPVVVSVCVFLVGAPILLVNQRRQPFPLIDLTLFANRERAIAFSVTFSLALARFGLVLLIALYLQAAHGWSAGHTGLIIVPTALGMMVASPVAARLARHFSARIVATAGMALTSGGLFYLAVVLDPQTGAGTLIAALTVVGVGSGLVMTPNSSSIMASVAPDRRGVANALRATLQNVGTVTGTAVCLAIVTGPLVPADQAAAYAGTLSKLSSQALPAFTNAYHQALFLLAILTGLGAVASLLRNPPPTV
jgi:EmrB/QacA subfamily drug resistance transporter